MVYLIKNNIINKVQLCIDCGLDDLNMCIQIEYFKEKLFDIGE